MRCLLVGYGEIGQAVHEVIKEYNAVDIMDVKEGFENKVYAMNYDILLVCFPYSDNFVDEVKRYIKDHNCKSVLIFSTVAVGTTEQIPNAVHCPIEGRHPNLTKSLRLWKFMLGGYNPEVIQLMNSSKLNYQVVDNPKTTEFLKLASTSHYGVMLEYVRYVNETMESMGLDFRAFQSYTINYNDLYEKLGCEYFRRPILYSPNGNLGGHCVVPNSKILDKQFPNIFLKEIYRDKETE